MKRIRNNSKYGIFYNPNPDTVHSDDCVVRAISAVCCEDWNLVYHALCAIGAKIHQMPNADKVWQKFLDNEGFSNEDDSTRIRDITVGWFCRTHKEGRYILRTRRHLVAVVDGFFLDTWNSGNETVLHVFKKKE